MNLSICQLLQTQEALKNHNKVKVSLVWKSAHPTLLVVTSCVTIPYRYCALTWGLSRRSINVNSHFLTSIFVFMMTSTLAKSSLQTMSSNIVERGDGRVVFDGNRRGGGGSPSSWIWNIYDFITITSGLGFSQSRFSRIMIMNHLFPWFFLSLRTVRSQFTHSNIYECKILHLL